MAQDTANYPYWVQMMQDPHANFYQTQRAFEQYWANRKVTKGHGWRVFKRWEYMMQSRINPDGSIPTPSATFNAYEAYVKTAQHAAAQSPAGNWTSYGPSQTPNTPGYEGLGRINTVAFHPTDGNKLYIGAPAGGMWQSTDGGTTWTSNTDHLPTLGVSAIIILSLIHI
jgi:hypothetical protein